MYILWHPRRTAVLYCGMQRCFAPRCCTYIYLPLMWQKTSCYIIIIQGIQKPGRVHTHTPAWYIIKNQRAIVLGGKTNLHNICLYICSRWERGRGMSSLKGFRYVVGMGSCVCVCASYILWSRRGFFKNIPSSCVQYIIIYMRAYSRRE